MKVLNDILGYKNLSIYQDQNYFCFSLDSVILANYATIRYKDSNIIDLGCGNGVIPLIVSQRTNKNIYGIEIQKNVFDLAVDSIKYNNLDNRIKLINDDISNITNDFNEYFDLALCNPPYFKLTDKSYLNISVEKQIARHELTMDLDKLFSVSKRILKNNGNIAIVHRPERLLEIFDTMRKYNIEPKKIKFIYEKVDKESTLVLVEGQKCGKTGLKIENPLIMYNKDGSLSDEYKLLIEEVRK